MNRAFLIILLGLIYTNTHAQKINIDRIDEDGKRQIMTTSKSIFIKGMEYDACMKVYEKDNEQDWYLLISSYNHIPNSAEILLKLGNEEIIYLPANNVNIGKVSTPGYAITSGKYTTFLPSKNINYYSSIYELSQTNMDKIDTFGITKIRISNGDEYIDRTFTYNYLGKFLSKCREIIAKRLETPQNIFDGF